MVDLEVHEKLFPLVAESMSNIVPKPFNTSVVDAPET
jgi:hypothetical protein